MARLFFSYSHQDEALRNELEIHLAALQRQGLIEPWHDRRIGAGEEVDRAIDEQLDSADIILLLISPYFIASRYCYDVEMARALERHARGEAKVIPVILHPCDWHALPFGKLLATPTDGRPVSKFPNQHEAFLEISTAIRKCAEAINQRSGGTGKLTTTPASPVIRSQPVARSSNLRVKQPFSERDKDRFRTEAFESMANFFEASLQELESRNEHVETDFRRIDANQFTAAIYAQGREVSRCGIRLGAKKGFASGITYSAGGGSTNSYNEAVEVTDDGYTMSLKPTGMFFSGADRDKTFTHQGAAEYYWAMLMRPLQQ